MITARAISPAPPDRQALGICEKCGKVWIDYDVDELRMNQRYHTMGSHPKQPKPAPKPKPEQLVIDASPIDWCRLQLDGLADWCTP